MADRLVAYKRAVQRLPAQNELWPLYGVGLENLGRDGKPIHVPMPQIGPDQLLVRHDAVGLCLSDLKVIALGDKHPRIYRDLREEPAVLGHEVTMTVVGVGEQLRGQYKVGDRFIIQADVFVGGIGYAYGYMIQGGLSKYAVIDQRILNGDDGNYLLPVQPETGYAESALTEPWACVIAAYQLDYRTRLKKGGTAWIIGTARAGSRAYTISAGFDEQSAPSCVRLTNVPVEFERWIGERAARLGVQVERVPSVAGAPEGPVDDIVFLGADSDLVEAASTHLAADGILALLDDAPPARAVNVDIGRIHYDRLLYVGTASADIAAAYRDVPVRSTLEPGGRAWFVGAGGPMGQMHVQRAIQLPQPPKLVVCTDVSDMRLDDLRSVFADEAMTRGIEFVCLNPVRRDEYQAAMDRLGGAGFDDIVVLAPIPAVISDAAAHMALRGTMNIFAGVARGTMAKLDVGDTVAKSVRVFGHSASTIADLRLMLHQAESGELSPNRSVAAIGSLGAARDGIQAMKDARYPGKVVIFPQIKDLPLTPLSALKDLMPSVHAKLKNGREWTVAAEREFLEIMLETQS